MPEKKPLFVCRIFYRNADNELLCSDSIPTNEQWAKSWVERFTDREFLPTACEKVEMVPFGEPAPKDARLVKVPWMPKWTTAEPSGSATDPTPTMGKAEEPDF